jgi:hypothetical protein
MKGKLKHDSLAFIVAGYSITLENFFSLVLGCGYARLTILEPLMRTGNWPGATSLAVIPSIQIIGHSTSATVPVVGAIMNWSIIPAASKTLMPPMVCSTSWPEKSRTAVKTTRQPN